MTDGMIPYMGKFKPGDTLVFKEGFGLRSAYMAFSDSLFKDVYWIPSGETISQLRGKKLTVESRYFFHGGYPIYVLVFENDGQDYELRVCEAFLQRDTEVVTNSVTPTLFIALGGTGAEIALRLRHSIISHEWGCDENSVRLDSLDQYPLAQFLYYDLDAYYCLADNPNIKRITESEHLEKQVNFREEEKLVSKLEIDKYLRTHEALCRYPLIEEWFPCSRRLICELGIDPSMGTGQLRWLSRLYFFDKYQNLKAMIKGKIDSLLLCGITNVAKLERLGLRQEKESFRVVILASTAGGTGSGSFLDMGYLTKWLATEYLARAEVDLLLMLPGGFKSAGRSRTEANAYGALMELETCIQQEAPFFSRWSVYEESNLPRTPFDNIFLFDSTNLVGKKASTVSDLYNMAADVLFEELTSPHASGSLRALREDKKKYKFDPFQIPVDSEKYGSMKIRYSKSYSSFGRSVCDIQMLESLSSSERKALFYECIAKSMSWVGATIEESWFDHPYKYICLVSVNGAQEFEKKYGEEFRSALPAKTGLTACQIRFRESSEAGKITCYVELIGMPLLALNDLPGWRISYEEENMKIPVHLHKDKTLFVNPMPPTMAELEGLAEDFKLFIQGIALGVLAPTYSHEKPYCISICGELRHIGKERLIRIEGLLPCYHKKLNELVNDTLDRIRTPLLHAALVVLYDFYAHHVYPPARSQDEYCRETMVEGFCHVMCRKLAEDARKSLEYKSLGVGADLLDRLRESLEIWTDEIEGSEVDLYEHEVGSNHLPKRVVKREFFEPGWLEAQYGAIHKGKSCTSCGLMLEGDPNYCPECGGLLAAPLAVLSPPQLD